jgi:hypothetical protein
MGAKSVLTAIKDFAARNYRVAKALYNHNQLKKLRRFSEPPILIHQMGKVGSKSIRLTLEELGLDRRIFHTHHLNWERIRELENERREFFRTERFGNLRRPWESSFIREQIDNPASGLRWKVITLTRDPIGRNLSGFFENIDFQVIEPETRYSIESHYYSIPRTDISIEDLSMFYGWFFECYRHNTPLTYFDQEIRDVFGIDIYATEFPRDKGYGIYSGKNADVLLIRIEDLNECAPAAFKEFLDLDNFTLTNTNVGSAKDYAPVYRKFKNCIQLPQAYVDSFYDSKFVRHMYSETEIEGFRFKWEKNTVV